ncbi:branched-chain amino acid ABC transporter permease [[Brevibacterium] flavum]|uniref:Branched-chain amino acid ABC transporter permease n=1 Tax=[Brevibacterium] flavum TaxID=92706 RepID=A0A0F6SS05_9CORY|nr:MULTISPECIES: AzlC family ABC transporter permease [Corynebacterium]AKF28869.1 branched-chain amino acid ABC transporter permease [[Brevibacterium] flavum]ANE09722.1 branched-chain amino acid ABC transporter permease [Corynebacterium glutamicum]AST22102.1 branched-chain amino acid ABC transporter permease [Corynebacterium glutamicum ATCC 14067]KEI21715.1 branched-chain amino acid ABC transporter permease [Corynebacterium glutamicum ATCC 14067]KIH75027.1 branched-chain amino acid ABC transpo
MSAETLKEIRGGISETLAVGLGLIPLGLAFGLLMVQTGFAWWWTPIFSIVIYAGSMEFLAIGMVTAGIGPISAAVAGFMVNFRHIFYGLTFPRHTIKSKVGIAYSTYALTDESYAIVSARPPGEISGTRTLTIQVLCQALWVIPGIIGAVAGQVLPAGIKGMDFALTALFVVLAWEAFKNNKDYSLPLSALVLAVAAGFLAPAQMLVLALTAYFVILLLRFRFPRVDAALELRARDE